MIAQALIPFDSGHSTYWTKTHCVIVQAQASKQLAKRFEGELAMRLRLDPLGLEAWGLGA